MASFPRGPAWTISAPAVKGRLLSAGVLVRNSGGGIAVQKAQNERNPSKKVLNPSNIELVQQPHENSCNSLIGYDRMFDLVFIEIDQIGPLQDCCVTVHYCWDNVFTVKTNEPLM